MSVGCHTTDQLINVERVNFCELRPVRASACWREGGREGEKDGRGG